MECKLDNKVITSHSLVLTEDSNFFSGKYGFFLEIDCSYYMLIRQNFHPIWSQLAQGLTLDSVQYQENFFLSCSFRFSWIFGLYKISPAPYVLRVTQWPKIKPWRHFIVLCAMCYVSNSVTTYVWLYKLIFGWDRTLACRRRWQPSSVHLRSHPAH